MAGLRLMVFLLFASVAFQDAIAADVTPVAKVITLLEGLKAKVALEGETEAKTYATFATFCYDTTDEKSGAIVFAMETIQDASAALEVAAASRNEKSATLGKVRASNQQTDADLAASQANCAKQAQTFKNDLGECADALYSLNRAIESMEDSKGTSEEAVSLLGLHTSLQHSLIAATKFGFVKKSQQRQVDRFLQNDDFITKRGSDSGDPSYKFHSQSILDVLTDMKANFIDKNSQLLEEQRKATLVCSSAHSGYTAKMEGDMVAMNDLGRELSQLGVSIGQARETLVKTKKGLEEDQLYLSDLTSLCETKARDWDQRTQARAEELKVLTEANEILTAEVKPASNAIARKLFLLNRNVAVGSQNASEALNGTMATSAQKRGSLLQISSHVVLKKDVPLRYGERRTKNALAILLQESHRLGSGLLLSAAIELQGGPFREVKALIQKLVERLLQESAAEATKTGFCTAELTKATQNRDTQFANINSHSNDIREMELKVKQLQQNIATASTTVATLQSSLKEASDLRAGERTDNSEVLNEAQEGLLALDKAVQILHDFYSKAGRVSVIQVSPVDKDDPDSGFTGSYRGKQVESKGIFGLLDVLKSNFLETRRSTEAAEAKAASDFVKFQRESEANIAGTVKQSTLDQEKVETTKASIEVGMDKLQAATDLLDTQVEAIEKLTPMCVDKTQAIKDKMSRRDEEVAALKKALCLLDPENKEPSCT